MTATKTSSNKPGINPADDLADARQLYHALASLVDAIDNEWRTGTPLIPLTKPDCMWDDKYPAELTSARNLVTRFKGRYSSTAALYYPGTDVAHPDPTETVADAHRLYEALAFLVGKIDNQRKRGMPLIPLRRMGGKWDDKCPGQLTAARDLVKRLKRKYRGWP